MVKRLLSVCLLSLLVLGLLSGCSDSAAKPTEPAYPPTTELPAVTEPIFAVDEDTFYFSNELEYARLYRQNMEGNQLELVLDTYCNNVQQVGNKVYYLSGWDLCVYDITQNRAEVVAERVFDYAVDGNDMVYYMDTDTFYLSDMRYRNLETGEDRLLEEISAYTDCDIANGTLYYGKYDEDLGRSLLCACDLKTFDTVFIGEELNGFYQIRAVENGIYFQGSGDDYTFAQYFASPDGSVLEKVECGLTQECQMFHQSEGETFCVYSVYTEEGVKCCIHRHNTDGTISNLKWGEDDGYFTVEPLRDGLWLVTHTYYEYWKAPGSNEEYGNTSYRFEYLLLDEEGNLTPIDATGEMGKMFADGDFPIMDSSTARIPVTTELYSNFVAKQGYAGIAPLCSTTHGAWLNIADRTVDIALLAAPTKEEMDYLNERSVSIEMKLYGGDGLVFIGNSQNPVQDLTHEQIIAIYQGKIRNWSEVGGPDQPITVYYRDDQSGSQRLFEKMVFKGLELPDYEKLGFGYMDEMSTIVDIVMDDPYAIGYSIMTYLDDVYENEALQVFAVNGIAPSVESVKNGTYPYHTQGYVVIRSDELPGSPARRLFDWFGSPVCDEILTACGVTPLHGEGVG